MGMGGFQNQTWWTFRIFFFFCSGRGRESSRRREGLVRFLIENPTGGGVSRRGRGRGGQEGVCGELGIFFGRGGGLNIFFRGRNVHQAKNARPHKIGATNLRTLVIGGFKKALLQNPREMLRGRILGAMIRIQARKSELQAKSRLVCRKWGCNKWGFKGCLATLASRSPKLPFYCLFRPFPEGPESTLKIPKTEEKGLFPRISSNLLKPPSLKPPFAAPQVGVTDQKSELQPGRSRIPTESPRKGLGFRCFCRLATGKYGCTEVPWERSLKIWELQISCFEEFSGGENVWGPC